MKLKLHVDLADGNGERIMYTNMFAITEWERLENRKLQDMQTNLRFSDMCCWAHTLCTMAGDKTPDTWREWVKQHPDMTITPGEDVTNPNPTVAAPTAAN